MSTVGDPRRFAVEYALNDNFGGVWLFGKVCFWISSERVGDYELGTSLRDFLFSSEETLKDRGRRGNRLFESMAAYEIFELLDGALFVGGSPETEALSIEEQWARHNITPQVDNFPACKIYLVEARDAGRLIYRTEQGGETKECKLAPGECDKILAATCSELVALYEGELLKAKK